MSFLETEDQQSPRSPSVWSVSNILAVGAVLISVGVWVEQARSSSSELAHLKDTLIQHDERVSMTYQRKDVAGEQYGRLLEQLARIERQLVLIETARRR